MAKPTGIINTVKPPNNSQVHDRCFDLSSREVDPFRRFYNNIGHLFSFHSVWLHVVESLAAFQSPLVWTVYLFFT